MASPVYTAIIISIYLTGALRRILVMQPDLGPSGRSTSTNGTPSALEPLLRSSPRKMLPFSAHPSSAASLSSPDTSPSTRTRVRTTRRLLYDQRRCISCLQPLFVLLLASTIVSVGILLLLQSKSLLGLSPSITSIAAITLISLGIVLPPISLLGCMWASTPSRARAQHNACLADALLEELLSGTSVNEHYDVYGGQNAHVGTVVILSAAAAPRVVSHGFAERVGLQMKTLTVDLPGHGSLVNVLFSLPRCERVLNRIIEREVAATGRASAPVTASGVSLSRRGTAAPLTGGDTAMSSSDEDARAPLGASMSSTAVYGSASMQGGGVGATAAMAARFGALRASYGMALGALSAGAGAASSPLGAQKGSRAPADSDAGLYSPPSFPATPMSERLLSPSISIESPGMGVGFISPATTTPTSAALPRGRAATADVTSDEAVNIGPISAARGGSVILVAYGASAYVAAHYAARYPHRIAGVVLLGPVPQYALPGSCTRMSESLYRLRWVAALANAGLKSRIQTHPKASDEDKAALLSQDWHFGVLPEFMASVRGQVLIPQLRSVERPILVLGPVHWTSQARLQLPVAHARISTVRGLKNEALPTLNPSKLDDLSAGLLQFAREAYSAAEQTQLRVRARESQSVVNHRSSAAGAAVGSGGGPDSVPIPTARAGSYTASVPVGSHQAESYMSMRNGSGTGSSSISERGARVTTSDSGAGDGFYWPKRGGTFATTGSGMPAHSLSTSVHAGFLGHGARRGGSSALATQVVMAPEEGGSLVVGNRDSE